jgi:hypothetical protein
MAGLKYAWDTVFAGGQAAWRRTQDYNFYDEAAVDHVFALLSRTHGVQVRSAELAYIGPRTTTVLAVGLHSEDLSKSFLGNNGFPRPPVMGPSGEQIPGKVFTYMTEPTVVIDVIGASKDIVRMTGRFVKTAMLSLGGWFMRHGMESAPKFEGSGDMEPHVASDGKEVAVRYIRRLLYSFQGVERLTPLDITLPTERKYALVHAKGSVVTSVPDPDTRTFTPISPISIGKVGSETPE